MSVDFCLRLVAPKWLVFFCLFFLFFFGGVFGFSLVSGYRPFFGELDADGFSLAVLSDGLAVGVEKGSLVAGRRYVVLRPVVGGGLVGGVGDGGGVFPDGTEFGDSGSCLDSDGGVFSRVRGAVEVEALDLVSGELKRVVKSDFCLSDRVLVENFCESGFEGFKQFGFQLVECVGGCYNGFCLDYSSLCELDSGVLRYQVVDGGFRPVGVGFAGGGLSGGLSGGLGGGSGFDGLVEDVFFDGGSGFGGVGLHGGSFVLEDPPAFGVHRVAVLLTKEPGSVMPDLPNLDLIMGLVRDYYLDISGGRTLIEWVVFGPYDLPVVGDYKSVPEVDRDIDFTEFQHLMIVDSRYVHPTASVTYVLHSSDDGLTLIGKMMIPSIYFMLGSAPNYIYQRAETIAHEFGHNFGARHADFLDCGDKYVDVFENCVVGEYGDSLDVMGGSTNLFSEIRGMNALFLSRVGFIDDSRVTVVDSGGVYDLVPLGSDGGVVLLKVLKKGGLSGVDEDYYYLEYRVPRGRDEAVLGVFGTPYAVYVRTMKSGIGLLSDDSLLIDMVPGNFRGIIWVFDGLQQGMLFVDPVTGLRMMTVVADEFGAKVKVEYC